MQVGSVSENNVNYKFAVTNQNSKKDNSLMEKFVLMKEELGEKIKNNDLEESFSIGNQSFTIKEWDKFIQKFDEQEEKIQEEIKEEGEKKLEESIKETTGDEISDMTLAELLGNRNDPLDRSDEGVPYSYLVKDGVINYNGVTFVADSQRNELQLGDCSDRSKCMTVYLEKGGALIVNENNFGELSSAISMFSPEDVKRILCAMADYKKIQETQQEIDEAENSIGEETDTNEIENE